MRHPALALSALAAALLCTSSAVATLDLARPSDGGQPLANNHAYAFTQMHRDNLFWWNGSWMPQTVPDGAHIQIQLPSNPIHWIPDTSPRCQPSPVGGLVPTSPLPLRSQVALYNRSTLPDKDRISGSTELSVFEYHVTGRGLASICLRPDPPTNDPEILGLPAGTPPFYVLTLIVGVPQVTVP